MKIKACPVIMNEMLSFCSESSAKIRANQEANTNEKPIFVKSPGF